MPSEKPKAAPAQPQPSDDLDKWIDSKCENDPIEVVEFIDDEAGVPTANPKRLTCVCRKLRFGNIGDEDRQEQVVM